MRVDLDALAEGLSSALDYQDAERLGARLCPSLVDAAKRALQRLEDAERDADGEWSPEVIGLQEALKYVGADS